MDTAGVESISLRWRVSNNTHICAITSCNELIGLAYYGMTICWKHYNRHCESKNRFSLARYAEGENSKYVAAGKLLGVSILEVLQTGEKMRRIKQGDEVAWRWGDKTLFGVVDVITSKDADTVNRTRKTCLIKDAMIIWINTPKGRIGLVADTITPLEESEEEEIPETIDELIDML